MIECHRTQREEPGPCSCVQQRAVPTYGTSPTVRARFRRREHMLRNLFPTDRATMLHPSAVQVPLARTATGPIFVTSLARASCTQCHAGRPLAYRTTWELWH